jgi:hypothetical protein|tara:strand:+ start:69 stop:512 length:444 start_codon:yes stop_codon:yes gene_type:complete
MAYQGKFKPQNPRKYMGDCTNIVYRSHWELKLMSYLDKHPKVINWASEEVVIPYKSPIDGRWHRYFPDFYVEQINKSNKKEKILIEVKPKYQTVPPAVQSGKKPTKRYINEVKTWGINKAKWEAAGEFCLDKGWKFQIMHEDHLGIK